MGKIVRYLGIALILILTSILVVRSLFGVTNSAMYRVFKSESKGYHLYKLLGIIPKEIGSRYERRALQSDDNTRVISLIDKQSPVQANFILLQDDNQEYFLKAYPYSLLETDVNGLVDESNFVSFLIDLQVFNNYLTKFNISDRNEIISKFFFFISNQDPVNGYRQINKRSDLDSLVVQIPRNNSETLASSGYNIIDLESIDFESEEVIYCWFTNFGLVKFLFTFDGTKLMKVESINLGYLGNEYPSCC